MFYSRGSQTQSTTGHVEIHEHVWHSKNIMQLRPLYNKDGAVNNIRFEDILMLNEDNFLCDMY